jgi:hypothetical protein
VVRHAQRADTRRPLVLDLDLRYRPVHRDRRVGLQHHQADHDDERRTGEAAVTVDGREAVEDVRPSGCARCCGPPDGEIAGRGGGLLEVLGVEHEGWASLTAGWPAGLWIRPR